MDKLISVDKLIKKAAQQKVNFGKGDPYNRLRYYTKIGWLPHMVRKKEADGEVKGHYPESALETLIYIEGLKSSGLTNEQIQKRLDAKSTISNFKTTVTSKSFRNKIIFAVTGILLLFVISSELGFIKFGALKTKAFRVGAQIKVNKAIASGDSFVPRGQRKVEVSAPDISVTSRVIATFAQDYFPATRYWISEIKPGVGFTLEMDSTPQNNSGFSWWVIE